MKPYTAALLCGLGLAAVHPGSAEAQVPETSVPAQDRTGVELTVYGDGTTLVKDRRRISLQRGVGLLAFQGVSGALQPETALLRPAGEGPAFRVVEQVYDFHTLGRDTLLRSAEGGNVILVTTNPATGEEQRQEARLISARNGSVVVEVDGRVEVDPPGRIQFPALPPGLRAEPTLSARLDAEGSGEREVELSYLAGGLSWRADYVAELPAEGGDRLDLRGWVTVTNDSDTAFPEARLKVVAGEPRRVSQPPQPQMRTMMMKSLEMAAPAMAQDVAEQAIGGYHLYDIDRPVDIAPRQTKQIELLGAPTVAFERQLIAQAQPYLFRSRVGELPEEAAEIVLSVKNDEESGLGMPLPGGVVRAYQRDASGAMQFLGEDRLNHTATGQEVRLTLGRDMDVPVRRRQTEFQRVSDNVWESSHEVRVINGKGQPVTVILREHVGGDWEILQESAEHTRFDATTPEWQLQVPAGSETVLTYRVRVRM